jgi:hypothetical protein
MSVELPGRWLDPAGVERDCTVVGDTPDALQVRTAAAPLEGARVVCRVPDLGTLRGLARGPSANGFRLEVQAGEEARRRLAARLRWHAAGPGPGAERRDAIRIVPHRPEVRVAWDGGGCLGRLRDVSTHGAAVELDPLPPVGTAITVGCRRAHVVRRMEAAVGLRFILPLRPADVTEDVVL